MPVAPEYNRGNRVGEGLTGANPETVGSWPAGQPASGRPRTVLVKTKVQKSYQADCRQRPVAKLAPRDKLGKKKVRTMGQSKMGPMLVIWYGDRWWNGHPSINRTTRNFGSGAGGSVRLGLSGLGAITLGPEPIIQHGDNVYLRRMGALCTTETKPVAPGSRVPISGKAGAIEWRQGTEDQRPARKRLGWPIGVFCHPTRKAQPTGRRNQPCSCKLGLEQENQGVPSHGKVPGTPRQNRFKAVEGRSNKQNSRRAGHWGPVEGRVRGPLNGNSESGESETTKIRLWAYSFPGQHDQRAY